MPDITSFDSIHSGRNIEQEVAAFLIGNRTDFFSTNFNYYIRSGQNVSGIIQDYTGNLAIACKSRQRNCKKGEYGPASGPPFPFALHNVHSSLPWDARGGGEWSVLKHSRCTDPVFREPQIRQ